MYRVFLSRKEKELEPDRHEVCLLRYTCWGWVEGPAEQRRLMSLKVSKSKAPLFPQGGHSPGVLKGIPPITDLGQMLLGQALWRTKC